MSETQTPDYIQNICAIIEERDKKLCEIDVKCKYYKDVIETTEGEIKSVQKDIKRIKDEDKEVENHLEKTEFIFKSLQENENALTQSLIYHQTLDKIISKELENKHVESIKLEKEFRNLYESSRLKMTGNPRYKELEQARVKFRRANIELRDLNVQIALKKSIVSEKLAIQKKRYYAFFIHMAEDYMVDKKLEELQKLKEQKLSAIKKLYDYQESVKARQKLGIPKVKRLENIIFGNQDNRIEKQPQNQNDQSSPNKIQTTVPRILRQPQPVQQNKLVTSLREKLNIFKQEEETEPAEIPQKVRIIEQVVVPGEPASQFAIPENPEATITNLSKKLQRIVKTTGSKKHRSQQVENTPTQPSQQSEFTHLLQESKTSDVTNLTGPAMATLTPVAHPEKRKAKVIKLSKKWQTILKTTGTKEQLSQQMESTASQLSQQSDLVQSQESQSPEEPAHCQALSDQPLPKITLSQKSNLTSTEANIQQDVSASRHFVEPSKTVRFTMESKLHPKKSTEMFPQGMFDNPFQSFFDRKGAQDNLPASVQPEDMMSNLSPDFNNSSADFNNTDTVFNLDDGVSDQEEQFTAPETEPFGGGSMFSFGLNKSLFPFQ